MAPKAKVTKEAEAPAKTETPAKQTKAKAEPAEPAAEPKAKGKKAATNGTKANGADHKPRLGEIVGCVIPPTRMLHKLNSIYNPVLSDLQEQLRAAKREENTKRAEQLTTKLEEARKDKTEPRVTRVCAVAMTSAADEMMTQFVRQAVVATVAAGRKTLKPEIAADDSMRELDTYPILSVLPSFIAAVESAEEPEEEEEEAKPAKGKKAAAKEEAKPAKGKKPAKKEDDEAHSVGYFGNFLDKIYKSVAAENEEYTGMKLGAPFRQLCANLVPDFAAYMANVMRIVYTAARSKSITERVALSAISVALVASGNSADALAATVTSTVSRYVKFRADQLAAKPKREKPAAEPKAKAKGKSA